MISSYHPRHASHPPSPPPPPRPPRDESTEGSAAALQELLAAGKDAARHGSEAARVGMWRFAETVRGGVLKLFLLLVAAVAITAVATTVAIWGTVHLLGALSAASGGGLLGCLAALVGFCGLGAIVVAVASYAGKRSRATALRSKLSQDKRSGATDPEPEPTELEGLQQAAIKNLKADKDRLFKAGSSVVREHPVASTAVTATSGFVAGRWLLRSPKNVRRAAAGMLRAGRAVGMASVMSNVAEAVTGSRATPKA